MIKKPVETSIRFGEQKDLSEIVNIYNQAIRSGTATGHLDEFEVEDRVDWLNEFNVEHYPIYVIEVEGILAGYGTLSPYRPGRMAMDSIAEISFFLDDRFQNQGLGTILVNHIINDCDRIGKKILLAILLDINVNSVRLLEKFGFEQWGQFPEVIDLRDRTCGQLIYGLKVNSIDTYEFHSLGRIH